MISNVIIYVDYDSSSSILHPFNLPILFECYIDIRFDVSFDGQK